MTGLEFWKQREKDQVKYISEIASMKTPYLRLKEVLDSANGVLENIRNEIKQLKK